MGSNDREVDVVAEMLHVSREAVQEAMARGGTNFPISQPPPRQPAPKQPKKKYERVPDPNRPGFSIMQEVKEGEKKPAKEPTPYEIKQAEAKLPPEIVEYIHKTSTEVPAGKIPVETYRGGKVYLTKAEANKLASMPDNEARFDQLQKFGIVDPKAEYTPTTQQQAATQKRAYHEASRTLSLYKDKSGEIDFQKAITDIRRGDKSVRQALIDVGYNASDINQALKQSRENVIIGNQMMPIKEWNKLPAKYQEIALKQGFDALDKAVKKEEAAFKSQHIIIKGQAMSIEDWQKIPEKYQRIAYKQGFGVMEQKMTTDYGVYEAASKRIEPLKNKDGTYDLDKLADYVEKNKETGTKTLESAGFDKNTIKEINIVIEGRQTRYIQKGTGKKITEAEYKALGGSRERDKYTIDLTTGRGRTIRNATVVAAEFVVPGLYTVKHWNELGTTGKAISILADVLIIAPVASGAVRGARAVSTAGRLARLAGAAKGASAEVVAMGKAPIYMIFHPVGTAKASAKSIRSLAENIAHPKKIPDVVLTTTDNAIRIRVGKDMSRAKAMAAVDLITQNLKPGERPLAIIGNQVVELSVSPFMREVKKAGGGMVHASPDIGVFVKSTKIKYKPGMPAKEQGWFLSPEPLPGFAKASAFGKGKKIPVPVDASGKLVDIGKFRPEDIVRVDKYPIRELNFADAADIPKDIAQQLQDYAKKNNATLYGSFNEWVKIKKAAKPNDFDLVFKNSKKAIKDVIKIANRAGYEAKEVPHGVVIFKDGKWVKLGDIVSWAEHKKMLPGIPQVSNKVYGINVETLGKQYIGQSYGAVAENAKAAARAKKLEKAAKDVQKVLKEKGAEKMQQGFYVTSRDLAEKTVPSGKTFAGTVEFERVYRVGGKTEGAKQHLFSRIGPNSERLEIYLTNPLSKSQILKLKAGGLIEWAKIPFKPAITIRTAKGAKAIKGLSKAEVNKLAKVLKASGNAEQAGELVRLGRSIPATRAARIGGRLAAPTLSRFTRNVKASEVAREREIIRAEIERAKVRVAPKRVIETARATRRVELPERLRVMARIERPARAERIARTERISRAERLERAERVERGKRGDRIEKGERVVRVERGARAERVERGARPARAGRTTRAARVERPETPRTPRIPREPRTPRVPRVPEPARRAEKGKVIPRGASESEKRRIIRQSRGIVTWNMGKLDIKGEKKDVWHVRFDNGEHTVVMGKAPQGARLLADGPKSAYKTSQRIGLAGFKPFTHQHGAVGVTMRPAKTKQGAQPTFYPYKKRGRIIETKMGGYKLLSRKPIRIGAK